MRCPVCKAENPQGPQCRRCKADLSLLFALEEKRGRALEQARRGLQRGEWRVAMQYAEKANGLLADEDSRRLVAVAHLMNRDFAAAWRVYQDWRAARRADA